MNLFDGYKYTTLRGTLPEDRKKPNKKRTKKSSITPLEAFHKETKRIALDRYGSVEILDTRMINSSVGWVKYTTNGSDEKTGYIHLGLPITWCARYGITPQTHPQGET